MTTSRVAERPVLAATDPRVLDVCWTFDELARWLRLPNKRVLQEGVRSGVLPHMRIGRRVRFAPEHVRAIVELFSRPLPAPVEDPVAVLPGVSSRSRAAARRGVVRGSDL